MDNTKNKCSSQYVRPHENKRAPWMPDPKDIPKPVEHKWGVFIWNPENRYPESAAIKIYDRKPDAERLADSMTMAPDSYKKAPRGYVAKKLIKRGKKNGRISGW